MKSIQSVLQSARSNNATAITVLISRMHDIKKEIKAAHLKESRVQLAGHVFNLRCQLITLSAAQKGIKTELLARKLARPHVYKKHGKDDPRYVAWSNAQEGIGGAAPVQTAYKPMASIACQC